MTRIPHIEAEWLDFLQEMEPELLEKVNNARLDRNCPRFMLDELEHRLSLRRREFERGKK